MQEQTIFFNGAAVQTRAKDLQGLLVERGLQLEAAFACAVNNAFVPRARWAEQSLQAGDRLDVIAPITGG